MEIIREIQNAKDTVPAAVDVTPHTFTGAGRRLAYAGPDDLGPLLSKYFNIWLYFPTAGILAEVDNYSSNVVYLKQGTNITLGSAEVGHIVQGLLVSYQVENISGGTAAYINGIPLNASSDPIKVAIPGVLGSVPKTLDAVLIDATNSAVRVVEQR